MSISNVNNPLGAHQYEATKGAAKMQKPATSKTNFAQQLQNTKESSATGLDAYLEYLKSRYGNVTVKNVSKDQNDMDALGSGTAGTGNVVIAPNILEQMANDPEKAAYYEGKIQYYFNAVPKYQAELSAMGHEIHSSGIVIHPDGTVTHYICGDLKPEVRARIEAQIKVEQEEKANWRKQYQEMGIEAAEKRRLLAAQHNHNQMITEALQSQLPDTSSIYFVNQPQVTAPVVTSYENPISTLIRHGIQNI